MIEMKFLLLGKNGQLGWALSQVLPAFGRVLAPDWRDSRPMTGLPADFLAAQTASGAWADFRTPDRLYQAILRLAPDVIVNACAYTDVDAAQQDQDAAQRLNAEAPAALAKAAAEINALLLHYSSDYVYDGSGDLPWREDSPARPCNVYGETKLAGDEAIMASGCRHLILRSSWIYGRHGSNFMKKMMRLGLSRNAISVVDDQIGVPTSTALLASQTGAILRQWLGNERSQLDGLYHLVPEGQTSWYSYACRIFAQMRAGGVALAVREVVPVRTDDFSLAACRPLNCRLDNHKIKRTFSLILPPWQEDVDMTVSALCADMTRGAHSHCR